MEEHKKGYAFKDKGREKQDQRPRFSAATGVGRLESSFSFVPPHKPVANWFICKQTAHRANWAPTGVAHRKKLSRARQGVPDAKDPPEDVRR